MRIDFADWVKNRLANLVTYDPSNSDLVAVDSQAALDELAARHFGKEFSWAGFNPNFQTDSAGFVTALSLTVLGAPAGPYRMAWSYKSTNSKFNTNNNTQAAFNGASVVNNTTNGVVNLAGGLGEHFGGFREFSVLAGDLTVSIDIKRIAGNGLARINTLNLELWRI